MVQTNEEKARTLMKVLMQAGRSEELMKAAITAIRFDLIAAFMQDGEKFDLLNHLLKEVKNVGEAAVLLRVIRRAHGEESDQAVNVLKFCVEKFGEQDVKSAIDVVEVMES